MPQSKQYEQQFFDALKVIFVGAKVEGESGYINLMRIKATYFEQGVFPQLLRAIDAACKPFEPSFREELFDKLHDWWLFSRTDETLDRVILPYYDGKQGRIRDFHPDFVFWLVKGKAYTILFVDPKGMTVGDHQYKIDGYREHFRDAGGYRVFTHRGYDVRVARLMYSDKADQPPEGYQAHWCDSPQALLQSLAA